MVKSTVWVASLTIVYHGKCIRCSIDRRISIFRGEIFFRIFVSSPSSHFPPLIPRINVLFLKKKEKKERTGGEARSFRKRDEIKVAFPDPFVPWKNIRVGARRCRKQTPNAYEIRMKYLYVCGKQLLLPLLSPRGTRSRNGILISKEIFGHLEIAII